MKKKISKIVIIITICIFFMFLIIILKSFCEFLFLPSDNKKHIYSEYQDNKEVFKEIASSLEKYQYHISIDKKFLQKYKAIEFGNNITLHNINIEDEKLNKNILLIFKKNFIKIMKVENTVYFIYTAGIGADGIVYAESKDDIKNFNNTIENIEGNWYYFFGE